MRFLPTKLAGVVRIEPFVHKDPRGFFFEAYHKQKFKEAGIPVEFVQSNHSQSVKRTLRGLHAQLKKPQGKLIRVLKGEIFDVAVDIRENSPTFGRWEGFTLSQHNFTQLYVPPGFAHGFCVLSDVAEVEYMCTDFYDPMDEASILWNDPDIGIRWPIKNPILSDRDRDAKRLREFVSGMKSKAKIGL